MEVRKDEIICSDYKYIFDECMTTTNDHLIEKWIKYRDIQREISDREYQQDKKETIINKYRIDLINLIEIRIDHYEKQRPIEGTRIFYERRCLRKNRFSSKCAVVLMDSTNCPSYGRFDSWCPFLKAWFETSKGKRSWLQLSSCIEACAQGIVVEAGKHNMIDEATSMAQQLRLCSTSSRKQATELCMRFYTQDTFLYDELNKALRQCDLSKLSTLAPIAFLISNYSHSGHEFVGTVYRGVTRADTYRKKTR